MTKNDYVGVFEFARATGRSLNWIYQSIWTGNLPAKKVEFMGKRVKWLIKRSLIEEYRKEK